MQHRFKCLSYIIFKNQNANKITISFQQMPNNGNLMPHPHHPSNGLPTPPGPNHNPPQPSPNDPQPSPATSDSDPSATPNQTSSNRTIIRCARPGCTNPIQQRSGWGDNSEFCSNECVVGQCREVYTSWSSNANNAGQGQQHASNINQYATTPVK